MRVKGLECITFKAYHELECEALITWEIFKAELNKRFFLRAQQQQREIEFQNLVQGSMTVEQYSAKFMEFSMFDLSLVPDKETKVERFQNGLNPRIKEKVICHKIKDFTELVDVASLAERSSMMQWLLLHARSDQCFRHHIHLRG
jgi:hypothetical protein